MTVDVGEARSKGLATTYEGREYVFCGKGCFLEFGDDPETFLAGASPREYVGRNDVGSVIRPHSQRALTSEIGQLASFSAAAHAGLRPRRRRSRPTGRLTRTFVGAVIPRHPAGKE